jgi:hypothetical protein
MRKSESGKCVHETQYDLGHALTINWDGHPIYTLLPELFPGGDVQWYTVPCQRLTFTYFGTHDNLDSLMRNGGYRGDIIHVFDGSTTARLWLRSEAGSDAPNENLWEHNYERGEYGSKPYMDLREEFERITLETLEELAEDAQAEHDRMASHWFTPPNPENWPMW